MYNAICIRCTRRLSGRAMKYHNLGTSDLVVSEVMLGTWAMGGNQWGPTDDAESIAAIRHALELGITSIDTAPAYGYGHAEELVGRAIKGFPREQLVIATKTGLAWDAARPFYVDNSRDHIIREIENSLRRLDVDYVDILQVHWPARDVPMEETIKAMGELEEVGKIKYIGVCNSDVPLIKKAMTADRIVSLQVEYSLLNRRIESEIVSFCQEHGIGIIVYAPLARGLLTGKFKGCERFSQEDVRQKDARFQGDEFRQNISKVECLRGIAQKHGKTPAQAAIRWVLEQEGISAAIVGAKRASQVQENAGASSWHLPEEDIAAMEEIFT